MMPCLSENEAIMLVARSQDLFVFLSLKTAGIGTFVQVYMHFFAAAGRAGIT